MLDFASIIKEKKYFIKPLAIIVLILILDLVLVLRSQLVFLGRAITKVNALREDINKVKKDAAGGSLLQQSNRLRSDMLVQEKRIVLEEELPLFLSQAAQLAKDSNVKLRQIKPAKLAKEDSKDNEGRLYFRLPIDLELICGYHALGVFINKLERSEKYIRVFNFDVSSVADAPFEYPVKMAIEILLVR